MNFKNYIVSIYAIVLTFVVIYFATNTSKQCKIQMISCGNKTEIKHQIISNIDDKEISIEQCNKKFREITDETSIFHPKLKNKIIKLYKGKELIGDDILYGYDLLFEQEKRFASASWLGVQSQQDPSDAFLIQIILFKVKPDLIIDIGTNVGGSSIFFASIMNYYNENGKIITIDTKDYKENWYKGKNECNDCVSPETSPLWKSYVTFYKGFSNDAKIVKIIKELAKNSTSILINHDGSHDPIIVYQNLKDFADLCTIGSYMIVQDTKVDRFFKQENKLHEYVDMFLAEDNRYINDRNMELYFFYTQHPKGFLKRIK